MMRLKLRVHPAGAAWLGACFLMAPSHAVLAAVAALTWHEAAHVAAMALCGFVACPADAAPEVRVRADYICPQRGGEGAVRGAVEKILRGDGRWNDAVKKAFQVEL